MPDKPSYKVTRNLLRLGGVSVLVFMLVGCSAVSATAPQRTVELRSDSSPAGLLLNLSDRFLRLAEANDDFLRSGFGELERNLPHRSLQAAQKAATQARLLLQELSAIPLEQLSQRDALTAALLRRDLRLVIEAPVHYWVFFDITPYNSGYVMSAELLPALSSIDLAAPGGIEHYLDLFTDSGRFIDEMTDKLLEQRRRGIMLPKAAIPGIRKLYSGLREKLIDFVRFDPARLIGLDADRVELLRTQSAAALRESILPALDLLQDALGDDYMAQAPAAAGLYQYPGGDAYYQYLIRRETSLDLTPDQIHEMGLQAMTAIQKKMQEVRLSLGFTGTAALFHLELKNDRRFYASTPEEVEQRYEFFIRRIEPRLPEYFLQLTQTPYGVKRASPLAETSMTHGYYRGGPPGDTGYYYYNGSNLENRSLISAGFLIYHELIPGHHFHLSSVKENQELSVYRRGVRVNAFTEGWANYASHLALEMGLFEDPYDHYGWLASMAYISARLVLDTGLNHKGWSLEAASRYMLENTLSDESEVATEVLRYSTDIQAQALSYKLGYDKILELRRVAGKTLGDRFDIREFHSAILSSGTLALPVLEQQVDWFIAEELKKVDRRD